MTQAQCTCKFRSTLGDTTRRASAVHVQSKRSAGAVRRASCGSTSYWNNAKVPGDRQMSCVHAHPWRRLSPGDARFAISGPSCTAGSELRGTSRRRYGGCGRALGAAVRATQALPRARGGAVIPPGACVSRTRRHGTVLEHVRARGGRWQRQARTPSLPRSLGQLVRVAHVHEPRERAGQRVEPAGNDLAWHRHGQERGVEPWRARR